MVCGLSGTGRSTFVNCLCGDSNIIRRYDEQYAMSYPGNDQDAKDPFRIEVHNIELEDADEDARISLTIIDTPGFGCGLDNTSAFDRVAAFLQKQFDDVLLEESRIKRNPKFKDNRVHCCIYFIEPTGHGLKQIDVDFMTKLATKVNVIPVIGHADQLTSAELAYNKHLIMEDILFYSIPIYTFPVDDEDDYELVGNPDYLSDEYSSSESYIPDLKQMIPFALVCSTELVDGVLVRQYPWGTVEVENPAHSDFIALKQALLGSHLTDLKEITHDILYENYRTERLSGGENLREKMTAPVVSSGPPIGSKHNLGFNYRSKGSSGGFSALGSSNSSGMIRASNDSSIPNAAIPVRSDSLFFTDDLIQGVASAVTGIKGDNVTIEDAKFREIENRVQREIEERRHELNAREEELREIEAKITAVSAKPPNVPLPGAPRKFRPTSAFPISTPGINSTRNHNRGMSVDGLGMNRRANGSDISKPMGYTISG